MRLPWVLLIKNSKDSTMKSIILWLCGVPVIVIIGLKIFGVF